MSALADKDSAKALNAPRPYLSNLVQAQSFVAQLMGLKPSCFTYPHDFSYPVQIMLGRAPGHTIETSGRMFRVLQNSCLLQEPWRLRRVCGNRVCAVAR